MTGYALKTFRLSTAFEINSVASSSRNSNTNLPGLYAIYHLSKTYSTPATMAYLLTAAMKLRYLLLGRKAVTNLDSILKSGDITLPTKTHIVEVMVFPVIMYGCESWTIKEAEC